jgi:WD40 repeat protein
VVLPEAPKGDPVKITCSKCGAAITLGKSAGGARPNPAGSKPAPLKAADATRPVKPAASKTSPPACSGRGRTALLIGIVVGVVGLGGMALTGAGVLLWFLFLRGPSQEEMAAADAAKALEALAQQLKEQPPSGSDPKDVPPPPVDPKKDNGDPKVAPPEKKPEPEKKSEPPETKPEPEKKSEPPEKKPEPEKKVEPPAVPVEEKKDPVPPPPPAPPKEPITVKLDGGVRHLALSPDGKLVALAWHKLYENGVNVYQWPELTPLRQWKAEVGGSRGLAFGADGKTLYAVDPDLFNGRVKGFDTAGGKALGPRITLKNSVDAVAASPDQALVLAGNKSEVKAWNAATGKDAQILALGDAASVLRLEDARFTPDGKVLLAVRSAKESQVRLWDPASGQQSVLVGKIPGFIRQLAVTRDGSKVVLVFENPKDGGGVSCCDRAGMELWSWKPPIAQSIMWTIALSPDEKCLAVAGNASTIRVLDMADGKVLGGFVNANFQVQHLAFHPDGKLVSADQALRVWDLADLRPVDVPKEPVIVKKESPPKEAPPKGPQTVEYKGAVFKQFDFPYYSFEVNGKPVRVERLKETAWVDASGAAVVDGSPRHRLLTIPGNVVDITVRSDGSKQELLRVKLIDAVSEVPPMPGNFELKGARVKEYGARRMVLVDDSGKEHTAMIQAQGICYDKTSTLLEAVEAAKIFKVNNVVDVWLYPEPKRDFNHVNVARLVRGELMTEAELKAPPPQPAMTERLTGKLRIRELGGMKKYLLGVTVVLPDKKKGFTTRDLQIDGESKAFDMEGKAVPWATIFHDNNTLEVVMETRGTISLVKEAKLISGVAK